MAELTYLGGIWTPGPIGRRYGPELAYTAGGLFQAYQQINEGRGTQLLVPVEQLLHILEMDDTTESRRKLNKLVNAIGHKTGVGTRMEHGVVSAWFTAEVEHLIKTYQRLPGGASQ